MIRRKDGIHVEVGGATGTVVADARSAVGDVNLVSHAHADHTFRRPPDTVCCSATTAALVEARTGTTVEFTDSLPGIELLPAGHVAGSRAALIEGVGERDRNVLYTGDFSTRDRAYLSGFDPVPADVLVMETTYGDPAYRFPAQSDLEAEVRDWLADTDAPLFLFGYSLGRAQKLQKLAREATNRPVVASDSVLTVNDAIEAATGVTFDAEPLRTDGLDGDEMIVLPSNQARSDWVENLVERVGGLKAGFSGWAVDDSFLYRGGYDVTFPLTDHCDFDELLAVVEAVDPETVYTHHGYEETFAAHLQKRGYAAQPLLSGQRTLSEFA